MNGLKIRTSKGDCTVTVDTDCLLTMQISMDCDNGEMCLFTRKIDYARHTRSTYHKTALHKGDTLKICVTDDREENGDCISEVYERPRPRQYTKEEMLAQMEELLKTKGLL